MRVQSSPVDSRSTTPHSHMATRSSPVAMCLSPPGSAGQGMVGSLLRARTVELLPRRHNEVGEPSGLVRTRGQPAVWRRPPYALSGSAKNLQATGERQSKLMHGPAQPFHEQGAVAGVIPIQHRASVSADETQDGRLVGGVVPGPWDEHLQDGRATIRPGRVRHESLRAALIGRPTVIDQSASRLETSAGNRSSQSPAPTARALFRTTAGTSIIASVSHLQPGATPPPAI
jgi:hypothetical protein